MRMNCIRNSQLYLLFSNPFKPFIRRKSNLVENAFPERFVKIQTCGSLYKKWKEEKKYSNIPYGDLTFNVPYTDTCPNDSLNFSKDLPTVVALHGAPGSWKEFLPMSSYLHNQGCRVIAPNFPDFETCKPGVFHHTSVEKSQYIKDFLAAIYVNRIDLLVCHSAAAYTALELCLDNKPEIKSLALLNPGTFDMKGMRATKDINMLKLFVTASENPFSLRIIEVIGPFILKKILKTPIKFESILSPLLSAASMIGGNIPQSKEKFKAISQKIPILLIFSENDPLVSTKPSYKLSELLGANVSDIFTYNKEESLVKKGTEKDMLKVIAFQEGSHYAFLKYPNLVNSEIYNFLQRSKNFRTLN